MAKGLVATDTLFTCTSVVKFAVPLAVTFTIPVKEPLFNDAVPSVRVVDVKLVIPVIVPDNVIVNVSVAPTVAETPFEPITFKVSPSEIYCKLEVESLN
jgi:hypothetical protein